MYASCNPTPSLKYLTHAATVFVTSMHAFLDPYLPLVASVPPIVLDSPLLWNNAQHSSLQGVRGICPFQYHPAQSELMALDEL